MSRPTTREVGRRTALAIGGAVVGNLLVLALASVTVGPFGPLTPVPVVLVSTMAAIGAAVAYLVLSVLVDSHDRAFVVFAAVVLAVSFLSLDFAATLDGATIPRLIALGITHVVAAVVIVVAFTDRFPVATA